MSRPVPALGALDRSPARVQRARACAGILVHLSNSRLENFSRRGLIKDISSGGLVRCA